MELLFTYCPLYRKDENKEKRPGTAGPSRFSILMVFCANQKDHVLISSTSMSTSTSKSWQVLLKPQRRLPNVSSESELLKEECEAHPKGFIPSIGSKKCCKNSKTDLVFEWKTPTQIHWSVNSLSLTDYQYIKKIGKSVKSARSVIQQKQQMN